MLIFLFILLFYGVGLKTLFLHFNQQYSAFVNFFLFATGSALYLPYYYSTIENGTLILDVINKEYIMELFVPLLLFHSGYAVNVHIFVNLWKIILLLAIPILTICSVLYAAFFSLIFQQNFLGALIVGFILGATDPISVISTLKSVGAPKQLEIILDGESLLNDGIALFLFHFAEGFYFKEMTIGKTFTTLFASLLLSPVFGLMFGIIVKFLLRFTKGNSIMEKGIILSFVYFAFMVPEFLPIGMSGVISVVFYGLYMSYKGKYYLAEEAKVESAMEFLSEMVEMFVFYGAGFICMESFFTYWNNYILVKIIAAFTILNICRFILVSGLSFLRVSNYEIERKSFFFIAYSSARGAITMSMGLSLLFSSHNLGKNEYNFFVEQMLVVFGVVMLSIMLNGGLSHFVYNFLRIKNRKYYDQRDVAFYRNILNKKTAEKIASIIEKGLYKNANMQVIKRMAFIGKKEDDEVSYEMEEKKYTNCNRNYLHSLQHLYNFEFRHNHINKIVIFYLQEAVETALDFCERTNVDNCADIIQHEYFYLIENCKLPNYSKWINKPIMGRIIKLHIYNQIYLFYQVKKYFLECHYKVLEELGNVEFDYIKGYLGRYEDKFEHEFQKIVKQYPEIVQQIVTRECLKEIYNNKMDVLGRWKKHGKIDKTLERFFRRKIEAGLGNVKNMAPSFYV